MTLTIVGFVVLRLLGTAFFVLLAIRIFVALKGRGPHSAHALLDRRFAEGQISADEYRARKAVLDE